MAANVRILKLVTGEDILTEVIDTAMGQYNIKNPVRIVVMPSKTNPQTPQVGLAPWGEFSDDKQFTIDRAHVIASMKPVTEFVNQYNGMFGGIVMPSSKILPP